MGSYGRGEIGLNSKHNQENWGFIGREQSGEALWMENNDNDTSGVRGVPVKATHRTLAASGQCRSSKDRHQGHGLGSLQEAD